MTLFDVPLGSVAAPVAVLDHAAMTRNLASMVAAAQGVPLRIASKSIRVRGVVEWAIAQDGVEGVLAYSLREALWLVGHGVTDVLVAYPSVDVEGIRALAADERAREAVTLMVDSIDHVDLIAGLTTPASPVRVALDIDMSLHVGRVVVGPHRTSLRTPDDALRLARRIHDTAGVRLVGCMFYEAQVAGVPDLTPGHRLVKWASMRDIVGRRRAIVDALRELGDLEIVNGGGTGTVHITGRDGVLSDIAVGSGLFSPTLFDRYRALRTQPACYFASPVTRKPADDVAVTFSGGYLASGPATSSRVPVPVHPGGLRYFGQLGAGEVQTPLRGEAARGLGLGDLVWFRHAKAGEMCERFDSITVVENGEVVGEMPTYRGEGKNFG